MKINSLSLSGFRSHIDSKIDGLGRLVLVLGPNGSGKSGLLDAIAYLFTGACRGTDERGSGSEVLLSPATGKAIPIGSITAETDKGQISRMVGQGPKSAAQERIASKIGLDRQSLRCALRSQAFLDMDIKDQEALLRSLSKSEVTQEQAAKALGVTVAGIQASMLTTMDGTVQAYQLAYGSRTALKKQLDGLRDGPAEPPAVEWDGIDGSKLDNQSLDHLIDKLGEIIRGFAESRSANQKLDWLRGEKKGLLERVDSLREKIKPFPARAEAEANIKSLTKSAVDEESAREKRREQAADWLATARDARNELERTQVAINKYSAVQTGKAECSACGQVIDKLKIRKMVEDLLVKAKECEKAASSATAAAKKLDDGGLFPTNKSVALKNAQADLATFDAIRAEGKAAVARVAEIDKLLLKAPAEIGAEDESKAQAARAGLAAHKAYRAEIGRIKESRASLQEDIDNTEAAVKALAVGGPVRALHMGDSFKGVIADISTYSVTLGVGEISIINLPKWGIAVNGRPAEMLSASERWRVSLAFAAVIAKKTGVNLICLDGADILDSEMRTALMVLIEGDTFDQIIITATSTKEPGEGAPGWTMLFLDTDENGVSQVLQPAVA